MTTTFSKMPCLIKEVTRCQGHIWGSRRSGSQAGSRIGSMSHLGSDVDVTEPRKESLGSKRSYMLTLIGYAVGFGNLWRFPYKLHKYGGIFLIPYTISVVFLGLPVLYLELFIAQRLRKGPVGCWNEVSPYLGGIGLTSSFICLFTGFYYNTLIAYCLAYLFDSFRSELPWHNCTLAFANSPFGKNISECTQASSSSKYYWFRGVLDVSESIETIGNFNWEMYFYLLLAWFLVGFVLIKGLEFTGKIVYFTACFPYVVLLIFLIFGWTLHGMGNGYKEIFWFDLKKLAMPKLWMDAATQLFFSLGTGCGVLISYSSLNPVRNNAWLDSIVLVSVSSGTSLLCSFVVVGILGFKGTEVYEACHTRNARKLAKNPWAKAETCSTLRVYIEESGEGTGLAFIAFTEAIAKLPVPQFFNFLFFLMLLTLGIDSSFGTVEGTMSSVLDIYPKLKRWQVAVFVSWLLTLFSLVYAFGWGNHVLTLLDTFTVEYPLLSISLMECIAIGWVYGLKRFCYDIQLMTGKRPNIYIQFCIKYFAPLVLFTLIISSIVMQCIPDFRSFEYFPWNATTATEVESVLMASHSVVLAFIVVLFCILWIPIVAIFTAFKRPLLKPSVSMEFPELELIQEREFDTHPELLQPSRVERFLFSCSVKKVPEERKEATTNDDDDIKTNDSAIVSAENANT